MPSLETTLFVVGWFLYGMESHWSCDDVTIKWLKSLVDRSTCTWISIFLLIICQAKTTDVLMPHAVSPVKNAIGSCYSFIAASDDGGYHEDISFDDESAFSYPFDVSSCVGTRARWFTAHVQCKPEKIGKTGSIGGLLLPVWKSKIWGIDEFGKTSIAASCPAEVQPGLLANAPPILMPESSTLRMPSWLCWGGPTTFLVSNSKWRAQDMPLRLLLPTAPWQG